MKDQKKMPKTKMVAKHLKEDIKESKKMIKEDKGLMSKMKKKGY